MIKSALPSTARFVLPLLLALPVAGQAIGGKAEFEAPFLSPMYEVIPVGDVVYGSNFNPWRNRQETLLMDLYLPDAPTLKKRPAFLFLHGGGFYYGDKRNHYAVNICARLAQRGYVAASLNYRLRVGANGPNIKASVAEDAKAAIRWMRKNASQLMIDPDRIGLGGDSSAAEAAFYCGYDTVPGKSGNPGYRSDLQYLMLIWGGRYDRFDGGGPAIFAAHGYADVFFGYWEAARLLARAQWFGTPCELFSFGGGHADWSQYPTFFLNMVAFNYETLDLEKLGGLVLEARPTADKLQFGLGGRCGVDYELVASVPTAAKDLGRAGQLVVDPANAVVKVTGKLPPGGRVVGKRIEALVPQVPPPPQSLVWQVIYRQPGSTEIFRVSNPISTTH